MNFELLSVRLRSAGRPKSRVAGCEPLECRIALTATADAAGSLQDLVSPLAMMGEHDPHEGHTMYPGGVMVTPTEIMTHMDTIPRFAAQPTIMTVSSGNWNDPATWSGGRVPRSGDRVMIGAAHSVSIDSRLSTRIDAIEVGGTLSFASNARTRLLVANLTVMPEGHLRIGTAAAPVQAGYTAELIIADKPLDLANDPRQFGTGLIAFGEVTIHGAEMSQTWQRLSIEPKAGDRILWLSQPVTNWRAGDTLILPDTRQVDARHSDKFREGAVAPQWEEAVIQQVYGQVVILAAPLKFDHLGARNTSGELELLPHVAMLNRNVTIRSENAEGTRGHTLFTARAEVDIAYALFLDLGRTDAMRSLDNTTFDEMGNVTHIGTNQIARYAVHFHHLMGPENPSNTGNQYEFVGNTVARSKKWAIDVHGTSFGLVDRNVIYDAQGAGLVTEDGTEIGNTFSNNIALRIQGTYLDGKDGTYENDYGRGGVGFWFRRGGNTIIGNVAANNTYAGFVISGYNLEPGRLPLFRGASVHDPEQSRDGTLTPSTLMINNEAYGLTPIGLWAAYVNGNNLLSGQAPTFILNLRLWNIHVKGVWAYHTSDITFHQLLILGDLSARNRNDWGATGMDLRLYESLNTVVSNSRIEGMYIGIRTPTNDSSQFGNGRPTIISNSALKNYINLSVTPPQEGLPTPTNLIEVRNVKFELVSQVPNGPISPDQINPPANIMMSIQGDYIDYTRQSVVRVYSYNQVAGDDFQVFYHEQVSGYVMPQTYLSVVSSRERASIGSPAAGLTNIENWYRYGLAMGGAVAPSSAKASRPEINGLVAPIQSPSATPRVTLVTPWNNAIAISSYLRVRYNLDGQLPAGAKVYVQLDDNPPVQQIYDGGLFNITAGAHRLRAYIGDAAGNQLPGTTAAISNFFRF